MIHRHDYLNLVLWHKQFLKVIKIWGKLQFNIKAIFPGMGIPMLKMRRSRDRLVSYTRVFQTSAGCLRSICLVHQGVQDKRRVSEIDLSQPRHETAFWWCHNGPMTSQLTDRIKWPNYPLQLIWIYVNINTYNKESLTQICRRSANVQMCFIFLYISIWFKSKWMACLISHHK